MYNFYDYCHLVKEIVLSFGSKEFTNKDCKERLYACLTPREKIKEFVLVNAITKRVEKIEIEVLPDKKIEVEKFYYSINVDKMIEYLEKKKIEEVNKTIDIYENRECSYRDYAKHVSEDYRYRCNFIETKYACQLEKFCDYMYENNIETLSKKEVLDLYSKGEIEEKVAIAVLQKFKRKREEKGFVLKTTPEEVLCRISNAFDSVRINKDSEEKALDYVEERYKEVVRILRNGL